MKKLLLIPVLAFLFASPIPAQVSNRMTRLSQVVNYNLPLISGIRYNDCWGWVDSLGREFAIIGSQGYTFFVDITNPSAPVVCDSVAGGSSASIWRDFKTYRHYAYGVSDQGSGSSLQVIDLKYLPDSVHKVYDSQQYFTTAHNIFIDTTSGRLYVAGSNTVNNGMIILDIATNPEQPALLRNASGLLYFHDIYVRRDTAYCSAGNSGLRIYDCRNPASIQLIGSLPTYSQQGYNHSSWLTVNGSRLIMADETHGIPLHVVDVTNMGNLGVTDTFITNLLNQPVSQAIPHNPFVAGQYCVISYYHDGVQVYDVSNPDNPVQYAWYDTEPSNTNYNGYTGCWGTYPYFPSGTIIGSDVTHGLFVLRANFPFPWAMSSAMRQQNVSCYGGRDGEATCTPSGGTPPYTYLWSNGDIHATATNLGAGTYTVTAYDRYGNPVLDTVVISQPPRLSVSGIVTDESCPGTSDGKIQLNVNGGTPPYSYGWSNGATGQGITGVTGGSYTVDVRDSLGCTYADTFQVNVTLQLPQVSFTSSTNLFTVNFTGVLNGTTSVHWDFGDGDTSNLSQPTHVYAGMGAYQVCLYGMNACGTDTFCDSVFLQEPQGMTSFSEVFGISPNPVQDVLNISWKGRGMGEFSFQVYDLSGRKVKEFRPEDASVRWQLPVSDLPRGPYFLEVRNTRERWTGKWMKD